jgi:hypothetical protein
MPDYLFWDFKIFKHNIDDPSLLQKMWHPSRRFLKRLNPFPYWRKVRNFIQRGRRGWADCDTWDLEAYLSGWLPAALSHYKEHLHGFPANLYSDGSQLSFGFMRQEAACDTGFIRWKSILDKMIAAFDAAERIQDGMYDKELGKFWWYEAPGASAYAKALHTRLRLAKERELACRDQAIFDEGAGLFIKWFFNIWD